MYQLGKFFLSIKNIFPIRCVCCGQQATSNSICERCLKRLEPYNGDYCHGCGEILDVETKSSFCLKCILEPRGWEWIRFYGLYEGLLKDLILRLKFDHDFSVLRILQKLLISVYFREKIPFNIHMIVPVPTHKVRLQQRGFNQVVEIARGLSKATKLPLITDLLVKVKNTPPQVGLPFSERAKNVRGAYLVKKNIYKRNVVLIDDVYTTGSTLDECTKALKKAGADKIVVMVLARGRLKFEDKIN